MAAHVGEGPEHPVLAPGQEHPGACPSDSARWSPGSAMSSLRPTHIHPPSKKWRCSQANTPGVDVGGPGEHPALPEGQERPLELGADRAGRDPAWFE